VSRQLPMPGEKPATVWQPAPSHRRHPGLRAWPHLALRYGLVALAALAIACAVTAWSATGKSVTLVVNGEARHLRTHRASVEGLIGAAGVRLEAGDEVSLPLSARLEPGAVVEVRRAREVIVRADGETRTVRTRAADPRAILAETGVTLGPADTVVVERASGPSLDDAQVEPALRGMPRLPNEITLHRAQSVTVEADGAQVSLQSAAPTVGQALEGAGYTLYEGDLISPSPGTPLRSGQVITLRHSTPVGVQADGRLIRTRTHAPTIGALLEELGLGLSGGDYVLPSASSPIEPQMRVRVVRVSQEVVVEHEPIPFQTAYRPIADLELDEQRVLQEGADGVHERRVHVRYEDGVEVSRVVEVEWTAREPQTRLIGYGTRVVIRTLETPYGSLEYWRVVPMLATSYSASTAGDKKPGDERFGVTAVGWQMRRGIVAVDPRVVNLFARVYVPDYGVGIAADTGGAVKGRRIDLGYGDDDLVLWYEWVDVYLLTPVPPPDQIRWVLP
jgi:uncharacterized protein YabE (DUF348 family)